jgi:hypothetical protein
MKKPQQRHVERAAKPRIREVKHAVKLAAKPYIQAQYC